MSDSLTEGCSYDELDFLNSVKNGKNAVLSAVGQKGAAASTSGTNTTAAAAALTRHHLSKQSNMNPIDLNDLPLTHSAMKDVLKMLAVRNIRLEDTENATPGTSSDATGKHGGKSRRTHGKKLNLMRV